MTKVYDKLLSLLIKRVENYHSKIGYEYAIPFGNWLYTFLNQASDLNTDPAIRDSDWRLKSSNPILKSSNPRLKSSNPRLKSSNPRLKSSNPKLTSINPRLRHSDPGLGVGDPFFDPLIQNFKPLRRDSHQVSQKVGNPSR